MDSRLTLEALEAMVADRRREADSMVGSANTGARSAAPRRRSDDETVTVRFASPKDAPALERLAELDSGKPPSGASLVAEVDGQVVAALPLGPGPVLADPFRRTAEVVGLLRLREAQLRGKARGRRRRGSARGLGRRHPGPAHASS